MTASKRASGCEQASERYEHPSGNELCANLVMAKCASLAKAKCVELCMAMSYVPICSGKMCRVVYGTMSRLAPEQYLLSFISKKWQKNDLKRIPIIATFILILILIFIRILILISISIEKGVGIYVRKPQLWFRGIQVAVRWNSLHWWLMNMNSSVNPSNVKVIINLNKNINIQEC